MDVNGIHVPLELLIHILQDLDRTDHISFSLTCRTSRDVAAIHLYRTISPNETRQTMRCFHSLAIRPLRNSRLSNLASYVRSIDLSAAGTFSAVSHTRMNAFRIHLVTSIKQMDNLHHFRCLPHRTSTITLTPDLATALFSKKTILTIAVDLPYDGELQHFTTSTITKFKPTLPALHTFELRLPNWVADEMYIVYKGFLRRTLASVASHLTTLKIHSRPKEENILDSLLGDTITLTALHTLCMYRCPSVHSERFLSKIPRVDKAAVF